MQRIVPPIRRGDHGEPVANLQEALRLLLDKEIIRLEPERHGALLERLSRERREALYRDATIETVNEFQRQRQIPLQGEAGDVDDATAKALNLQLRELGALDDTPPDPLPEFQHLVRGQVHYLSGLPIPGIKVRAFDRHLRSEDLLGETVTDAEGRYEIFYSLEVLRRRGQRAAALQVRVVGKKDGEAQESVLVESDIIFEAAMIEKINLRVAGGIRKVWSDYEQLMTELEAVLEGATVSSLVENDERQEISFLSARLGRSVETLAQLVGAHKLAEKTGLAPEVFYGLAKKRMPVQLSQLLAQTPARRREALKAAIEQAIIPGRLLDDLDKIEERFKELVSEQAVSGLGEGVTSGPLGALLSTTRLREDVQELFAIRLLNHKGSMQKLWQEMREDAGLRDDYIFEVQFALQLGALTANHLPLVRQLQQLRASDKIKSVRDLAQFDEDDWKQIVSKKDEAGRVTFPDPIIGKDEAEKAADYAGILTRMIQEAFPVETLAHRIQRDEANTPVHTRQFFKQVLDKGVAFDFANTRIESFLEANPSLLDGIGDKRALTDDLKIRQRLFKIAPTHGKMMPLMQAGVTSATAISQMGQKTFSQDFGTAMGGEVQAMKIHAQATHISAATLNVIANLGPWFAMPMYVLPWHPPKIEGLPDWETLFGNFDLCACRHCRSVYSPAAYLAELLAFLKERKIDVLRPGNVIEKTNLLAVLFQRRPDLGDIELTCENTNLALPYLDLVNEILENAIRPFQPFALPATVVADLDARTLSTDIRDAFATAEHDLSPETFIVAVKAGQKWLLTDHRRLYSLHLKAGQPEVTSLAYQTWGSEAELAANPSHVNAAAYEALRATVHPWSLPLDLWTEEARVWLDKAGVERADLMRAFQPLQAPFDPNELAIACETLGLNLADMEIITGADTHQPWEFWGLAETANEVEIPNPAKPAETIIAALDWDKALSHVRPFLRQSGLRYQELLRLLRTRFVNPDSAIRIESADPNDAATCDTGKLVITNLDKPVLERIHKFTRLWRKLGWTMREVDLAITVFQAAEPDINKRLAPRLIEQLAAAKLLQRELGVAWERLFALWGAIDTRRGLPNDAEEGEASLYDKLFLNPLVLKPVDAAFALNAERSEVAQLTERLDKHIPAILAGLEISASELAALMKTEVTASELNLANLSALLRRAVLAQGLGIAVDDLIIWKSLSGANPLDGNHPEQTLAFVQAVQRLTAAGFLPVEVDYLLRHQTATASAPAPDNESIAQVLTEIRTGLQKIQDDLVIEADLHGELTRKYLGLLKWDAAHIELVVSTLNANPVFSAPLEDLPLVTVFPASVQARIARDPLRRRLTFAGIMTAADRAALLGVAMPAALQSSYAAAVENLFKQSNALLDALRAYERPIFHAKLLPASMPSSGRIPKRLKSRLFYARKEEELRFSGLMLPQDYEELSRIEGATNDFKTALTKLRDDSAAFVPSGANAFFNATELTPLLVAEVAPAARFQALLEKLVPRLRRILSESLVKQMLSEALNAEPAALGHLMEATALEAFLAPGFAESHATLSVDVERFPELFDAFARLSKAAQIASKLHLDERQLAWYFAALGDVAARPIAWQMTTNAGWLDFRALPLVANALPVPELLAGLLRLIEVCETRDRLRPAGAVALEEIFSATRDAALIAAPAALLDEVAAIFKRRAGWDNAATKFLIGSAGLAMTLPDDLQDETGVARLARCQMLARRINATMVEHARNWARQATTATTAHEIKQALRARYGEESWQQIAKPAQDVLREKKRDALVAYLETRPFQLTRPDGSKKPAWQNLNELYGYFLIDVEMSACAKTSRLKQAISSTQLFVQRAQLNIEWGVSINESKDDAWRQWQWMKNYRVWEANRKIFLYPENWIEISLLDHKTPFFKDFENELLQTELSTASAEDAFLHYLEKLDAVAKLELVGLYQQDAADGQQPVLHVFGRTEGTPAVHYYRQRTGTGRWTPWERVELEIEGDQLIPIVWNRRLYLFWPIFTVKAEQNLPANANAAAKPANYFELQLAWSEYRRGKWSPKRVTSKRARTGVKPRENPDDDGRNDHVFFTQISGDGLRIWPEWENDPNRSPFTLAADKYGQLFDVPSGKGTLTQVPTFFFSGVRSDAVIETWRIISGVNNLTGTVVKGMRFEEDRSSPLMLPVDETSSRQEAAFLLTPGSVPFRLLYPHQDYSLSGRRPFFFEDGAQAFVVMPDRAPLSKYGWQNELSVDPGKFKMIEETYYLTTPDGKAKAKTAVAVQPKLQGIVSTTAKTSTELQLAKKQENFIIAEPWLGVEERLKPDAIMPVIRLEKQYQFQPFSHPYVWRFIKELNRGGLDFLLTLGMQNQREENFVATYKPTVLVQSPYPVQAVDFTPLGACSQYNWEVFFLMPFKIACDFSQAQQCKEAQRWFHYIFNPTDASIEDVPRRFWRVKPFHDLQRDDYLQQRIEQLVKPKDGAPNPQLQVQLEEWRTNPFSPHAIARLRLTAYQKAVVMKYLDNLIAWGDQLFRRDTIEAINEATQLYIFAAEILGPRPEELAPRAEPQVQTYNSLDPLLANFSNSLAEIEYLVPSPSPDAVMVKTDTPPLPIPKIPFFCVPRNDKLLGYWDTVADRLFKIRHCMNIEGVVRQLPLFEPPIDPALLVRATAAGVDLNSVLNDMNAPLPGYRFQTMAQKATELCAETKALGALLLAALEKRDAEALARLRSTQEIALLKEVRSVREQQIKEAAENLSGLEKGRLVTQEKEAFNKNFAKLNPNEQQNLDKMKSAQDWEEMAQMASIIGTALSMVPEFDIGIAGFSASPIIKASIGGSNLSRAAQFVAGWRQLLAAMDKNVAESAASMAKIEREWDERQHQAKLAQLELDQIDRNIEAARIRKAIAEKELANHDLQVENARAVDETMRSKFTNRELYDWMVGQLSSLFFQSYQLTYDVAKRAERCCRLELGIKDSNFIQFGYWDSLKKGLLAGERLYQDIKRMEVAYLDQHRREHEITKHISLALLHPQALEALRKDGACFFDIPEALFDLDHPGHYLRRIKSVSLSLPCVAGPHTSVSATLTLLSNRTRLDPSTQPEYAWTGMDDPRFAHDVGGIQSIVTSTANEDSGVFELNFRDDRYLPFEGSGCISSWKVELPRILRQFDYETLADAILIIRYTARPGGEPLKTAVNNKLLDAMRNVQIEQGKTGLFRLLSLRRDFADRWQQFLNAAPVNGESPKLTLELNSALFPAWTREHKIKIKRLALVMQARKPRVYDPLDPLSFAVKRPSSDTLMALEAQAHPGDLSMAAPGALDFGAGVLVSDDRKQTVWQFALSDVPANLKKTIVTPDGNVDVLDAAAVADMALLCRYTVE